MISHGFYFRFCSLTVQFDVAAYTSFFKYRSTVDVFVFAGKRAVKGNSGLNKIYFNDTRNRNVFLVCDLLIEVHYRSRYIIFKMLFLACCVRSSSCVLHY